MVWMLAAAVIAGATRRIDVGFLVSGLGAAATVWRGHGARRAMAIAALVLSCTAWGVVRMSAWRSAHDHASRVSPSETLNGTVAGYPIVNRWGATFPFRARLEGRDLTLLVRSSRFDIDYGERLRLRLTPVRTRRTDESLFASGTAALVRAVDLRRAEVTVGRGGGSRRLLWRAHRRARTTLCRRLGAKAGLPVALLLGERGQLRAATTDRFRRLGISHLLALSGLHLGLIAAALWWALRACPGKRTVIAGALLTLYVGFVGALPSLVRAWAMAMLLLAARSLQRPALTTGNLGRAVFLILCVSPASVYSVGLQLSVAATMAVLVVTRRVVAPASGPRPLRAIRTAVAASAGVVTLILPIQLHYFGASALVGPLATAAFVPVVAVVLVASAVAVVLDGAGGAGDAAFAILERVVDTAETLVRVAAARSPDPMAVDPPVAFFYYGGLAVAWWGRARPLALCAGIGLAALSFAL